MAIPFHTHTFPTASASEVAEGLSDSAAVSPAGLAGGIVDLLGDRAAEVRTAIGAGTGGGDLLAANNLSDVASASAARTALGLEIGTDVQAYSPALAGMDAVSVTSHGASTSNTSAQNETAFAAAEAASDLIYVPAGTYQLITPFNLNLDKAYFGPGVLQFDQADHRRRGGSSGDPLIPERYTVAYEFDSQSDVHVLFDGVEQTISSWPTNNTAEVFGDSSGQLVVIRVDNGRLRLGPIPQQIAARNSIGSGKATPFTPQTATQSSTGGDNTFFGARAGLNTIYSNNTYFGAQAGMSGPGGNVTAVGYQALYRSIAASNTAVGSVAMEWNTTGENNTAVGAGAGSHNVSGNNNVNVGWYAGADNQTGSHNVNIGYRAANNSAPANVASAVMVGAFAGDLSQGDSNIGVGYRAHNSEGNIGSAATLNVAVGREVMRVIDGGSWNAGLGSFSLRNLAQGDLNTGIGYRALYALTDGGNNVAVGGSALESMTTAGGATAVGYGAAKANTVANTVAVGYNALTLNTTGADNVAVGREALATNATGSSNAAVGHLAMSAGTGSNNAALGYRAGQSNTGSRGTFVGFEAGRIGATGNDCVLVGYRAGRPNTGNDNTALGSDALLNNTSGTANTALGRLALAVDQAGTNQTTYSNTTGVGTNARVSGSNQVQLGDSATTTYVYGTVQNRSDERDKADIRKSSLGLDFILAVADEAVIEARWDLREDYIEVDPETGEITRHEKDGSRKRNRFHQFVSAQKIDAIRTRLGTDFGGLQHHAMNGGNDVWSVGYDEFIPPMTVAIAALKAENDDLRRRIERLEEEREKPSP